MDSLEDTERANQLMARISEIRRNIDELKLKLKLERIYVIQERKKIQESQSQADWSTINKTPVHSYPYRPWTSQSAANFSGNGNSVEQHDNKTLIFPLPKQSLKDIEEKCETELVKLQRYIDNIKELRIYWKNAIEANNSEGFNDTTKNVPLQKSKKVFEGMPNYLRS